MYLLDQQIYSKDKGFSVGTGGMGRCAYVWTVWGRVTKGESDRPLWKYQEVGIRSSGSHLIGFIGHKI